MGTPPGPARPVTPWRIATRRSSLARAQARQVADALAAATDRPAELAPMATTGDEHPERAVEAFDSKGLFVDRTREAVLAGDCHAVVHSFKDLPTDPVEGLCVGAVPARADPRDVLVSRDGWRLPSIPRGGRPITVGTSSARRRAQIQRARRDVIVQPVRGNVDTRLRKVAEGDLDAVVVAMAGLERLKAAGVLPTLPVTAVALEHGECLHAPAQGALAVECRADDAETREALAEIEDADTSRCVAAERAMLAALEGGCRAPIGAHATFVAGPEGTRRLELLGMLADPNGTRLYRASHQAAETEAERLGATLAATLRDHGGDVLDRDAPDGGHDGA